MRGSVLIMMIVNILLALCLLSPTFGRFASVTKKVTEESKKITNAAELLNTASKETAELLGISQEEAKQQIIEAISSKNGLDKNGELLSPSTAFCPRDSELVSKSRSSSSCTLHQFVPIHPAGFPHQRSRIPFPFDISVLRVSSPDCEDIIANCMGECPDCNKCDKFRTIDGKCNNLNGYLFGSSTCPRNWGSRNQAFRRLTDNNYQDGASVPTGGKPLTGLPRAREVSNYIHDHVSPPTDTDHTHLLMQLGQFIDHDISFTPEVDLDLRVDCCSDPSPSNCFPMQTPSDPDFSETCKDFARSAPKCDNGTIRQQFNAITAYLDGSQIYGSDETLQAHLRTMSGGLLKVDTKDGEDFLPTRRPCPAGYGGASPLGTQFQAGDRRVTENPGLSGLHTVFMREHNRIANKINSLNSWDDERIYQEARRIVIAELQNIIYKEFLPIILGSDTVPHSVDSVYDPTKDASISNVFATAAYRFGHSLITDIVNMHPSGTYDLTEHFFEIEEIWDNGKLDNIMQGGAGQDVEASDQFIHDSVRNELFKNIADSGEGTDLAARNIQRGRDHGLGTFQTYKEEVCEDFSTPLWQSSPSGLFSLYGGYSKLEIFPGGLFEKIETGVGGLVGPTFRCLIKKQFQSLKDGDRFFFTHKKNPCKCEYNCNRFTTSQQNHIMNRSLRDILCDNTDINSLQPLVLRKSGAGNTVQPCPASSTLNVASLLTPTLCLSEVCSLTDVQTRATPSPTLATLATGWAIGKTWPWYTKGPIRPGPPQKYQLF